VCDGIGVRVGCAYIHGLICGLGRYGACVVDLLVQMGMMEELGWHGMGRDGMGWEGMEWDGMGWDGNGHREGGEVEERGKRWRSGIEEIIHSRL